MSTIQKSNEYIDKIDQLTETLDQAIAMTSFACAVKISELDEATIFQYFSAIYQLLLVFKTQLSAMSKMIVTQ
jgi:hypothetical protein